MWSDAKSKWCCYNQQPPPRLQDHAVCLCAGTVRLSPVSGVIALDCCPRRSSEPPRCGLAFLLARAMWLFLGLVHWQ